MKRTRDEHARDFQVALETAHPFNVSNETSITTLRKRAAWLLNKREEALGMERQKWDTTYVEAVDLVLKAEHRAAGALGGYLGGSQKDQGNNQQAGRNQRAQDKPARITGEESAHPLGQVIAEGHELSSRPAHA